MRKILITLAALACLSITDAFAQEREVAIVAHRGFWNCGAAGAKNSIVSLEHAQKNDFWGSEFDVNMTKDGKLLVYHDRKINGKYIEKTRAKDLEYFRLSNGESIPTLGEYLEQAQKSPQTVLVFELKAHTTPKVETKAVKATIKTLKEYGLFIPDRVIFIAFSRHMCNEFARLAPGFTIQYLENDANPDDLVKSGINGIDINYKVLKKNQNMYDRARANGMSINTWTVNKEEDIRKMIELGVDQITTDNPLLVRQILHQMGVKEKRAR